MAIGKLGHNPMLAVLVWIITYCMAILQSDWLRGCHYTRTIQFCALLPIQVEWRLDHIIGTSMSVKYNFFYGGSYLHLVYVLYVLCPNWTHTLCHLVISWSHFLSVIQFTLSAERQVNQLVGDTNHEAAYLMFWQILPLPCKTWFQVCFISRSSFYNFLLAKDCQPVQTKKKLHCQK